MAIDIGMPGNTTVGNRSTGSDNIEGGAVAYLRARGPTAAVGDAVTILLSIPAGFREPSVRYMYKTFKTGRDA